jgi:cation transport ATPase
MTGDLSRLIEVFGIAKRCYRVIIFNFWGTIGVDTIGIGLAFFGLLAPIVAALIHVGSELAFILNSARLFRFSIRGTLPLVESRIPLGPQTADVFEPAPLRF